MIDKCMAGGGRRAMRARIHRHPGRVLLGISHVEILVRLYPGDRSCGPPGGSLCRPGAILDHLRTILSRLGAGLGFSQSAHALQA